MDIQVAGKLLNIPQELVGQICQNLYAAGDIQNTRLINKCFNYAATPLMTDLWSSPSELFIEPHAATNDAATCKDNKSRRYVTNPFTIWNWLRIPRHFLLEDGDTRLGARFKELMYAPDRVNSAIGPAKGKGRKATCWGRTIEQPELFCIVFRKCTGCYFYSYED